MSAEVAAEKLREKLRKLFALLGSSNAGEREAARGKIDELLARNKKNWNDLTELLRAGNTRGWRDDEPDGATAPTSARPVRPAPLDLIRHILERHLHLTDHQLVALTLWIAHTFLFSRFAVTPRLIFESPVRGCGKTTGLNLIKALGFKTVKTDHITAAVTFRLIDRDRPTLLVDEADNQDLPTNAVLRAVINSGHHCDGRIMRYLGGEIVEFTTFAPLAFATISKLPLPILHRSVVIHMQRSAVELTRFDPKTILDQAQDCLIVYREVLAWAQQCELNLNPPMPEGLHNRPADNWRVLLSIADACSPAWSKAAREAAVALSKGQDEDLPVLLLSDIRDIFDRHPTADRLASAVIVAELNELPDGLWSEWRGQRSDQTPRHLSAGEMARVLANFHIRPRTIWPPRRGTKDRSAKGYFKSQFAEAWAAYCDGTPSQPSNVRHLNLTSDDRRRRGSV
jgi:uncharacterized protein DUF3631